MEPYQEIYEFVALLRETATSIENLPAEKKDTLYTILTGLKATVEASEGGGLQAAVSWLEDGADFWTTETTSLSPVTTASTNPTAYSSDRPRPVLILILIAVIKIISERF
jgi:hypothetical protein